MCIINYYYYYYSDNEQLLNQISPFADIGLAGTDIDLGLLSNYEGNKVIIYIIIINIVILLLMYRIYVRYLPQKILINLEVV